MTSMRLMHSLFVWPCLFLLGGAADAQAETAVAPAQGQFLVANDEMHGPEFYRTVILLVSVEPDGALGLVVNRPTPLRVAQVIPGAELPEGAASFVYAGGPVEDSRLMALVRSAESLPDAEPVFDDVYLLASWRLFTLGPKLAAQADAFRVFAGYAGWAPGQLEGELAQGVWSLVPADAELLFHDHPDALWEQLNPVERGQWVRLEGFRAAQR